LRGDSHREAILRRAAGLLDADVDVAQRDRAAGVAAYLCASNDVPAVDVAARVEIEIVGGGVAEADVARGIEVDEGRRREEAERNVAVARCNVDRATGIDVAERDIARREGLDKARRALRAAADRVSGLKR
jgi:hypothetical protein